MSRAGRPSQRRLRKLRGPHELYERALAFADEHGMPDFDGLAMSEAQAAPIKRAARDMTRRAATSDGVLRGDAVTIGGSVVLTPRVSALNPDGRTERYDSGGLRIEPKRDPLRALAWASSISCSLHKSAPEKFRCRHLRAAGKRALEIRAVAHLGTGTWVCLACIAYAGHVRQLWPQDCDLCGEKPQRFTPTRFQLGGTLVHMDVCDRCHGFWDDSPAATTVSADEARESWLRGAA